MTETPLSITLKEDNSDGFSLPRGYDHELALEKAGAVDIQQKDRYFEIYLINKSYRRSEPAIINLSHDSLFDVVQECRSAWEKALKDLETTRDHPSGAGQIPYHPYENEWHRPVEDEAFRSLGAKLALAGNDLFVSIFERSEDGKLDRIAANLREIARTGSNMLTVSTTHFHIPWRMIYTHPDPEGELASDGSNFEPSGFWGFQHVVEQYPNKYPISDRLNARDGKLDFGAALHERIDTEFKVNCIKRHRDFIQSSTNMLTYAEWTTILGLEKGLSATPFEQQVVYFLCHADMANTSKSPEIAPTLHLADGEINVARFRRLRKKFEPSGPLIFINACRGGQLGTLVRENFSFASQFLEQGAACVVGPQIEVPAVFAGEFGNRFFTEFLQRTDPPPRAGMVLRELTRQMWKRNNPFGLVYSLYAGADCHIRWAEKVTS
ncbi:CHAT domain-containing protein [Bradyrhizobium sp. CIAT3101]|uniref:CHAT domain-containing protein n=1 Tax=Bradyrhizobium sp. CIAT3101 TaxID=439387 RepID=UPI0024B1D08D|nr:CHAT domain-containing protein [Bradyrhizobium sp. CIAT3101]WFU80688.1 CHAT domain-containing protein [Bradyrhizobium sp. CIAT3101]